VIEAEPAFRLPPITGGVFGTTLKGRDGDHFNNKG